MNTDQTIREHFDALRAADERIAPTFHATLSRAKRKPGVWQAALAYAVLVGVIAAGVGIVARPARPASPQPSLSAWSSPTTFLLETPGRKFLRETPRFVSVPKLQRRSQ